MSKTACIFGSTGLIGSLLMHQLLKDSRYSKVIVFNRTFQAIADPKLEQIVGDYKSLESYQLQLKADEYFCCLGTTIKIAKTKPAFEYVDLHLPVNIGKLSVENQVQKYLIISSIGASAKSKNFYLNVKGRMEEEILKFNIPNIHILRPSLLIGKRNEKRTGESFGAVVMKIIGFLMVGKLKKYKAIEAVKVANAMVIIANSNINKQFIESDELQMMG